MLEYYLRNKYCDEKFFVKKRAHWWFIKQLAYKNVIVFFFKKVKDINKKKEIFTNK
jgi:hypothetical protein